jgi:serine protease Do
MKRILMAVLSGSSLLLSSCTPGSTDATGRAEPLAFPSPDDTEVVAGSRNAIERVVEEVLPAVVNVVASGSSGQGEGTGFIVREDGIIVTNAHVVENATLVTVLTSEEDPRELEAEVIGGDIQADLAVLDVDAEGLPTVPLGDSDRLDLGQQVVAIGYALGLEGGPSVTAGIVSSLSRRITVPDPGCQECENEQRVYADVVQTDAAINPGNSGGPLVDLAGNVVGINTAGTTAAENVGFAIQINAAKPVIDHAVEEPNAPIAYMGIGARDAGDPAIQAQFDPPTDEGALILEVVPGGPADEAGVQVGDVVIAFDGEPTATAEALGGAIRSHEPGDVVDVQLIRASGEAVTVTLELGENRVALG